MKRRSKDDCGELYKDYMKYKWELCRRNPDYYQDYQLFMDGKISRGTMIQKWGYDEDPLKNFDQALISTPIRYIDKETSHQTSPSYRDDLFTISLVKDENQKAKRMIIDIDTGAPPHLILSALEHHISAIKTVENPELFPNRRPQWGMLDFDLLMFDKTKEKKTIAEIAVEHFPRSDQDTAISVTNKRLAITRRRIRTGKIWLSESDDT